MAQETREKLVSSLLKVFQRHQPWLCQPSLWQGCGSPSCTRTIQGITRTPQTSSDFKPIFSSCKPHAGQSQMESVSECFHELFKSVWWDTKEKPDDPCKKTALQNGLSAVGNAKPNTHAPEPMVLTLKCLLVWGLMRLRVRVLNTLLEIYSAGQQIFLGCFSLWRSHISSHLL